MAKTEAKGETIEAAVFGFTAQLPAELVERYGVQKFNRAKLMGEEVDDAGQRWVAVRLPVGGTIHADRSDTVIAVALIRQADGYSVARLELPLKIAGAHVVETSDPESRGFAVDHAQRMIAEQAERA